VSPIAPSTCRWIQAAILACCLVGSCGTPVLSQNGSYAHRSQKAIVREAEALLIDKRYADAKPRYDEALRLGHDPAAYGGRAACHLGLGDIDSATADLAEAIRHSPKDKGQSYRPSRPTKLSQAALKHGEQQLQKMLKDRPAMSEHVRRDDSL
jgi:hypothetical protein